MKKVLVFLLLSFFAPLRADGIILCEHSMQTVAWMHELAERAEQSIEISMPYGGGHLLHEFLTTIERRMQKKPHLQVHLLIHPYFLQEADLEILDRLAENPQFHLMTTAEIPMKYPEISFIHNHIKLMVVDERYYIVGGTNLDDAMCAEGTKPVEGPITHPGLAGGGRDEDVVGRGEVAKVLRSYYYKLYAVWEHYKNTGEHIADPEDFCDNNRYFPLLLKILTWVEKFESHERLVEVDQIEAVFGGTMQSPNEISVAYAKLIKAAEGEILLGHLYFNPVESISKALLAAINRHVAVTLITNGTYENVTAECTKYFAWGSRLTYPTYFYGKPLNQTTDRWNMHSKELKKTEIYEYVVPQILFHKKTMIVDRKIFVIGSYNLGQKSDIGDYELVLIIRSPEVASQAVQVFNIDKKYSVQILPSDACKWHFDPTLNYLGALQRQIQPLI